MKFRREDYGWDKGLLVLAGTIVVSNILGWILRPEFSSYWTSHATSIVLWCLLQANWVSNNINAKASLVRLSNMVAAIAISISWTIGILFLTGDNVVVMLLGGALLACLISPLLWIGYTKSNQLSRNFMMVVAWFVLPAVILGALSTWGWREAKEMAALSKLHKPVFTAAFDANAPTDPYWPRHMMGFFSVPGKGFSWADAIEATQQLDDEKVKPSEIKAIFEPKPTPEGPTPDYRYTKKDLMVAAIGVSLEGSYQEAPLKSQNTIGAKRFNAYSSFITQDDFQNDARREWFYTSYPVNGLKPNDEIDVSGAMRDMPKTHALVQSWKRQGLSDQAIIDRTLDYFSKNLAYHFDYQIKNFEEASVDEFLFSERKGVCEQFANTFVRMMKSAGIPARLVSGFRGGDINPETGELVVRLRNAHAWAEVWMGDQGWVRVDPTDVVPVEEGVPDFSDSLMGRMMTLPSFDFDSGAIDKEIRNETTVRARTFQWVSDNAVWVLLGALLFAGIAFLIMQRRLQHGERPAKEDIAWEQIREQLSQKGYQADLSMGPRTLGQNALQGLPIFLREEWKALVGRYEKWKYGMKQDPSLVRDLKQFNRKLPKPNKTS